jgi:tetratricopeptide (TPR) repeat protein
VDIEKTIQSAVKYCQSGDLERAVEILLNTLEDEPENVRILNMLGVIYGQRADYDSAIRYFEKALSLDNGDVRMYNNLGNALCEKGRLDDAVANFQKAIELNPEFVDAYCDVANALHKKGQLDEAVVYLQKALKLKPDLYEAYFNLGIIFREKGEIEEAISNYEKALQINPNLPEVHYNLGNTLKEKGQLDDAISHYQKALELYPDFPDALNNLGIALQDKGELDAAATYFQKAIEIDPDLANAYNNLGNVYKDRGAFDIAIGWYEKALELNPDAADSFNSIGTALKEKGQSDEAMENFQKAIEINPDFAEAYYNVGNTLKEKGQLDDAISYYQKALELCPDFTGALNNLGNTFRDKGQPDEAIDQYRKAMDLNPDYVEAHFNMSLALLATGDLEHGWEEYEWRWKTKDFITNHNVPLPSWEGASLNGKSLLICAEQGVGDEIMFASCFNDVIERAKSCIVECDKRLLPLFARSFPKAQFIERDINEDAFYSYLPSIDFQVPEGSLPKYFRPDLATFPERRSYLVPDERQVSLWRKRYEKMGEGLKIGIAWRGGSKPAVRLARSTVLEQWKELFLIAGTHFISLQYGDYANELKEAKEKLGVTIFDWEEADSLKDLDNFAAQIAALDLVISVDNATVHMAGALGVSTWVLLPFACDWRWMRECEDTPWYATVRLFRQNNAGAWDGVFEKVTSGLMQFAKKGFMPDSEHSYKDRITPGP